MDSIRRRVAEWILTLPPASPRMRRLHERLPAWVEGGCEGKVPSGLAAEWAARAGASSSSASQILGGKRNLAGALRETLEGVEAPRARCLALLKGGAKLTEASRETGIPLTTVFRIKKNAGIGKESGS